jgi:hypothetical protein
MKTTSFLLFTFAIILIAGCENDNPTTTRSHVQFTFSIGDNDKIPAADLPDNILADLTLTSANGESQLKNIAFKKTEMGYITGLIEMRPGNYEINDFLILDAELSAVPGLVSAFRVDRDEISVRLGNVVSKKQHGPPLTVSVYIEEDGNKKLTNAMATLYNSDGEYYKEFQLSARPNHIGFTGSLDSYYELIIEKEGYWPSSTYFVYNSLEKKRLEITLTEKTIEPGPAITFDPSATIFQMRLQFMGTGSVVLDWMNGDPKEIIEFNVDPQNEAETAFFFREMGYVVSVPPARITGDVHLLKGLYFDADADGLDARYATGLQILSLSGGEMDTLDLSANHQLTSLRLSEMYYIGKIVLPQQHQISNLEVYGVSFYIFPSEGQLDYIIDNVYMNAVTQNILSGSITLSGVNVSAQSETQLLELRNGYGWTVVY